MSSSYLDDLSVTCLMAFTFLVEEGKSLEEFKAALADEDFVERWRATKERFRKLVRHYPDEDEEKHYLTATLDAVHGLDPYSDETRSLLDQYWPIIGRLLESD